MVKRKVKRVKVVTDSCSDITPQIAQEFGITVVPLYVQFGDETYRDNVDLTTEEFYRKLETSQIHPTTSTATPADFAEVFTKLADETKEILAITLYAGAGAQMLLVISAAKMAQSGANLDQIIDWLWRALPRVHIRMSFDTLEYLRRGGRIGKAQAFLGGLLKFNPVVGIKSGTTFPIARPRNRAQAINFLVNFVKEFNDVEAVAIEDATTPDDLEILAGRLKNIVPAECIYRSKVSPVVGAHVGPHVLAVAVLEYV